jgi:hypothetical protein
MDFYQQGNELSGFIRDGEYFFRSSMSEIYKMDSAPFC